jgi:Ras-related protein Rab-5C
MAPLYYRNATAAILAFDITSVQSFEKVQFWIDQLKENGPSDCLTVICGNKSDREIERTVSTDDAQKLAQSKGFVYFETSAKFDQGINSMFDHIAHQLPPETAPDNRLTGGAMEIEPVEEPGRKKSGCC